MHSLILEGENLIKNARNLFGLKKKELNYTAIFLSMKKKKIVIN